MTLDKAASWTAVIVAGLFCLLHANAAAGVCDCLTSDIEGHPADVACQAKAVAETPAPGLNGAAAAGGLASAGSSEVVERAVMLELLAWIEAHTDYDIAASLAALPSVSFCRHGEVIDYEGASLNVDPQLGAAYDKLERHIYLARPWQASSVSDRGRLLHELIHDVQYLNKDWPCWQKTEWEAYKLQEAWLAENGESADFNWVQILMLSRCSSNHHP